MSSFSPTTLFRVIIPLLLILLWLWVCLEWLAPESEIISKGWEHTKEGMGALPTAVTIMILVSAIYVALYALFFKIKEGSLSTTATGRESHKGSPGPFVSDETVWYLWGHRDPYRYGQYLQARNYALGIVGIALLLGFGEMHLSTLPISELPAFFKNSPDLAKTYPVPLPIILSFVGYVLWHFMTQASGGYVPKRNLLFYLVWGGSYFGLPMMEGWESLGAVEVPLAFVVGFPIAASVLLGNWQQTSDGREKGAGTMIPLAHLGWATWYVAPDLIGRLG